MLKINTTINLNGNSYIDGQVVAYMSASISTDTIEQAIERAGTKAGNKGYDAAVTAIEMANLLKQF